MKFTSTMLARGAFTAATVGGLALASSAQAVTLLGKWTTPAGFLETFQVQSTGGYVDPGLPPSFINFTVTNDSLGSVRLAIGPQSGVDCAIIGDSVFAHPTKVDVFAPNTLYNDNPVGFVLQPGVYTSLVGSTLTFAAVPEPDAWAMLIAGAAMAGGALRVARRRQSAATA